MSIQAKLTWEKWCDGFQAHTPFGSYTVEPSGSSYRWRYCFDEHYDEDQFTVSSMKEGKAAAQANWDKRISGTVERAARPAVKELLDAIKEMAEGGLIYWEPQTERGHEAKADMIAKAAALSAKYGVGR